MGWFDNTFGGGREQAGKDMYNQYSQGWADTLGMMNPYVSRGNLAYNNFMNSLNQAQDPVAFYNSIASQYKMSPEAVAQIKEGTDAANNAAAASGMLGSGAEQIKAADIAQSTRASDFDKFMGNIFGLRNQYLGGQYGIENQGFQSSMQEAQLRAQYADDMAKAKAAQDEGRASGWQNAIGAGMSLAGDIFGGPSSWFGGGGGSGMGGGATGGSWLNPDTGQFVNY